MDTSRRMKGKGEREERDEETKTEKGERKERQRGGEEGRTKEEAIGTNVNNFCSGSITITLYTSHPLC